MPPYRQALIFTGHMVDLPDRPSPRFPAAMETSAQMKIREVVEAAAKANGRSLIGIASGARGGDILFLESLKDQGLPFSMMLPFDPERFLDTSVRGVSEDWEDRFWWLWNGLPPEHRKNLELPVTDDAFADCNERMLDLAKTLGQQVGLLALWDGKDRELKRGGTAHFIHEVDKVHGEIQIINVGDLSVDQC